MRKSPIQPSADKMREYTIQHFKNIIECIKSGYFTFIAHLDYCTIFNYGTDEIFNDLKHEIIETLIKTKTPFELNTSGYDRVNHPHPCPWMLELLAKDNTVPILISDDAHDPSRIGKYFKEAETLLSNLNYTNRFTLDMLKKHF